MRRITPSSVRAIDWFAAWPPVVALTQGGNWCWLIVLGRAGLYHREVLMSIAVPAIREGAVHLYYAAADVGDDRLLEIYRSLLTPQERLRHDQFRFERDRRQYLVTRLLLISLFGRSRYNRDVVFG